MQFRKAFCFVSSIQSEDDPKFRKWSNGRRSGLSSTSTHANGSHQPKFQRSGQISNILRTIVIGRSHCLPHNHIQNQCCTSIDGGQYRFGRPTNARCLIPGFGNPDTVCWWRFSKNSGLASSEFRIPVVCRTGFSTAPWTVPHGVRYVSSSTKLVEHSEVEVKFRRTPPPGASIRSPSREGCRGGTISRCINTLETVRGSPIFPSIPYKK